VCSHIVAAAHCNGDLQLYLTWAASSYKNISSIVTTDMPRNAGKKKEEQTITRRRTQKPAVNERVKRHEINPNPFRVKRMTNQIQVCQGYRGSLRSIRGIPAPPYDVCIARKEKRAFKDKNGAIRTPSTETDAHYHLRLSCVREADPSFVAVFLDVTEVSDLTEGHKQFIRREFGA